MKFTICYYNEAGYVQYFTKIAPYGQKSWHLTQDSYTPEIKVSLPTF